MTSVHNELSKQVKEKVQSIEKYKQMDSQRENIIAQLIDDYRAGKKVDLGPLNKWTEEMNKYAVKNQLPTRKLVTKEMFEDYIQKFPS